MLRGIGLQFHLIAAQKLTAKISNYLRDESADTLLTITTHPHARDCRDEGGLALTRLAAKRHPLELAVFQHHNLQPLPRNECV